MRSAYQLQQERSPSAYVRSTGQEVAANKGFKNARLAAALTTDNSDLGQVQPKLDRHLSITECFYAHVIEGTPFEADNMRASKDCQRGHNVLHELH
jgi:hypothetical protein